MPNPKTTGTDVAGSRCNVLGNPTPTSQWTNPEVRNLGAEPRHGLDP